MIWRYESNWIRQWKSGYGFDNCLGKLDLQSPNEKAGLVSSLVRINNAGKHVVIARCLHRLSNSPILQFSNSPIFDVCGKYHPTV